jgi:hypothetical protein
MVLHAMCAVPGTPLKLARTRAVPLKVIAKFNRVKALAGASGGAVAALAAALQGSGALEVSAEGARVRRRAPLPELAPQEALERTVIADNLPDPLSIGEAPGMSPYAPGILRQSQQWPLVSAARPQWRAKRICVVCILALLSLCGLQWARPQSHCWALHVCGSASPHACDVEHHA